MQNITRGGELGFLRSRIAQQETAGKRERHFSKVFERYAIKLQAVFVLMKKIVNCILLILLLDMPASGHAEVYKWIDEQGQTHYEEKPLAANATELKIKQAPQADPSLQKRYEESDKLLNVYEEERKIREEEKQKAEAAEQKREQQCLVAKNEIEDMQQAGLSYYELDDKGERKTLSRTEREQRLKQLQEQYDLHCK
jgi:hypothetical protein